MSPFILTMGEALIDWVCLDRTLDLTQAQHFIKAPGGAPANVAVALAKLGCPVRFLGGFSPDIFGGWLRTILEDWGVDLTLSPLISGSNTRQAYVLTDEQENRVLKGFTQNACADVMLSSAHMMDCLSSDPIDVLYWGSVIQSAEPAASDLLAFIDHVPNFTLKIYDPNYREVLWQSGDQARAAIGKSLQRAHIAKLSDDEIFLLKGVSENLEIPARQLLMEYDLELIVVTMGAQGSLFVTREYCGQVPPFQVQSVEMTGAGDGFVAGLIRGLFHLKANADSPLTLLRQLQYGQLETLLIEANAVGALATTQPGAMTALPTLAELDTFLASSPNSGKLLC